MSGGVEERWLAARLTAPEPLDAVLVDCIAPLVQRARGAGQLKRFFFLRHGEGGLHLRLRLLPARGVGRETVRSVLEEGLRAGFPGGAWSIQWHAYDREALYFGQTAESVYAELLNESTSGLALGLLAAAGGDHTRRWLALAVLLDVLVGGSADVPGESEAVIAASLAFARQTAAALGRPLGEVDLSPHAALDEALVRASGQMAGRLAADGAVRRTARLLRRLRRRGPRGAFAATHALHLLCNKTGFTVPEEADLFTALSRLSAEQASIPSRGAPDERVA